MNTNLSRALIELSRVTGRKRLEHDPQEFCDQFGLSEVDRLALASKNRAVLKYQANFGDLSEERLRSANFASPELEHEHVEIGPEHEEGEESLEGRPRTASSRTSFGPYTREFHNSDFISPDIAPQKKNCLVIVGTGINVAHLTREAADYVTAADMLLYCVADPATELELIRLNPKNENLYRFYGDGKPRYKTYDEMTERIITILNKTERVCAAFYGHPGLFVKPAHQAIERARAEGYSAWMCPSTSSVDCLMADLGIDLSWDGCQIFEATHFLLKNRAPDVESGMILFQIGCVGDFSFNSKGFDGRHFPLLVQRLAEYYGDTHRVVLYEASAFSICAPRVDLVAIKDLTSVRINGITTMYIPPLRVATRDSALRQYFKDNAPAYTEQR
jgi:hypothetical protein